MKGENCMEILENPDNTYEWLKNIPSGECFKNIHNGCIYIKTSSTAENGVPADGCVDLSNGEVRYMFSDEKVLPVHATVVINHPNSNTLKEEGVIDGSEMH